MASSPDAALGLTSVGAPPAASLETRAGGSLRVKAHCGDCTGLGRRFKCWVSTWRPSWLPLLVTREPGAHSRTSLLQPRARPAGEEPRAKLPPSTHLSWVPWAASRSLAAGAVFSRSAFEEEQKLRKQEIVHRILKEEAEEEDRRKKRHPPTKPEGRRTVRDKTWSYISDFCEGKSAAVTPCRPLVRQMPPVHSLALPRGTQRTPRPGQVRALLQIMHEPLQLKSKPRDRPPRRRPTRLPCSPCPLREARSRALSLRVCAASCLIRRPVATPRRFPLRDTG